MTSTEPRDAAPASQPIGELQRCLFYHTMDLPGVGTVTGDWDLRPGIADYLANTRLDGRRVLDVGTASGFLAFSAERFGAEVVAFDLSPEDDWDVVPFAGSGFAGRQAERKEMIGRVNNSFWLAHRALGSTVRMVYGSVYSMPPALGRFDVSILGSILLHLRDPFRALEQAARLTDRTMIVADLLPGRSFLVPPLARWFGPCLRFLPDPSCGKPWEAWWHLSPLAVVRMLGVLGFTDARVVHHRQLHQRRPVRMFTVVANRQGSPSGA